VAHLAILLLAILFVALVTTVVVVPVLLDLVLGRRDEGVRATQVVPQGVDQVVELVGLGLGLRRWYWCWWRGASVVRGWPLGYLRPGLRCLCIVTPRPGGC